MGYDREAIFVEYKGHTTAILRHAIAWISFIREETAAGSGAESEVYSLPEFLKLVKGSTVEYTTVLSEEPQYLVLASFGYDSVELVEVDDATTVKRPKIIPLSALCSIGRGSTPPGQGGS